MPRMLYEGTTQHRYVPAVGRQSVPIDVRRLLGLFVDRDIKIGWSWRFKWTGAKMSQFRYFKDAEIVGLDQELVAKLDLARGKSGVPFVIENGKRGEEANEKVGGVKDSAHITGKAVDLVCHDSTSRFKMVSALLAVGFARMGVYDRHIHVDNDTTKPQNVLWTGISH